MIVTRKIEVVISATDNPDLRKEYKKQLYEWRNMIRKAANLIVSHKFVQQNIRDFAYIQDDILDRFTELNPDAKDKDGNPKFFVKDILKKEPGNSENNTTYRVVSSYLKGKCPAAFFTCLNQAVTSTYKERIVEFLCGKASIPSYKNIPIPFPGWVLDAIKEEEKGIVNKITGEAKKVKDLTLDFYHVPLTLFFGRDRSNNKVIIERALAGEYKFCGSSLMIDDDRKKMFLLVSVDIPKKEVELDSKKTLYAILDIEIPIKCSTNKEICDGPLTKNVTWIGNKEEYLHRRLQIQAALHRLQKASTFTEGGHGRTKKLAAIDRFHEKERNYIESRMHLYSKMLIDEAINKKCSAIYLANYKAVEKATSEDNDNSRFLLRNWGYHGLTAKIEYKAKKYGIKVIKEKEKETEDN